MNQILAYITDQWPTENITDQWTTENITDQWTTETSLTSDWQNTYSIE